MKLDDLISEAGRRNLSGPELDELARLAAAHGAVRETVGRLMTAGPPGAFNLRMARRLRELHSERTSFLPVASRQGPSGIAFTSSGPSISFSTHAVEQYVTRVRPDLTFDDAAVALTEDAASATRMRAKTVSGEEQWTCPSGAVLVVRRDGPGKPAACVTVLSSEMRIRR